MVEPVSLAASLLALATFGANASVSLYQTLKSFRSHKKDVRQLQDEVQALGNVLQSLSELLKTSESKLDVLRLPLFRCGQSCQEFEASILKGIKRSDSRMSEFKDWARLRYLGGEISQFRDMIASYKSTINIAIADINLRMSLITSNVLEEYQEMIQNTKSDLEEQIERLSTNLVASQKHGLHTSATERALQEQVQYEVDSFQQCLEICEQVSAHIQQLKPRVSQNLNILAQDTSADTLVTLSSAPARLLTVNALDFCTRNLSHTSRQLQALQEASITDASSNAAEELVGEESRITQALNSTKECLRIISQASEAAQVERVNLFEDVQMAEDGHNVIVSTIGDLISTKRVIVGPRSVNWMGQMSDESLQMISQNRTPVPKMDQSQSAHNIAFGERHGPGKPLHH